MGDDPVHSAFADGEVTLPELLSNHLGARFRVEEPVPDDLANDLLAAAVLGLGASLGADERLRPFFAEQCQELKITLAAVVESGNHLVDRLVSTLPGDKHGEFTGDLILLGNGEGAVVAANLFFREIKGDHGVLCSGRGLCHNQL